MIIISSLKELIQVFFSDLFSFSFATAVSVRYLTRRYIGEYSSDQGKNYFLFLSFEQISSLTVILFFPLSKIDHLYKHNTVTSDGNKITLELLDVSGDWCLKVCLFYRKKMSAFLSTFCVKVFSSCLFIIVIFFFFFFVHSLASKRTTRTHRMG